MIAKMDITSDSLSSLKVLIVEDQQDARAILRNMLSGVGIMQIFESSDGCEALRFIDSALDFVNIVICDWNMPGMTGVEFLRQIRAMAPAMPFVMITGRSDMNSVAEAKTAGVSAYIRKPFSQKQLEAKLRVIAHKIAQAG